MRRALELNPQLAITHVYLAVLFTYLRRDEEAVREALRAAELEPDSTLISYISGNVFYWLRRHEEARARLDRALELDPAAAFVHWARCEVVGEQGDADLAIAGVESGVAVANRPAYLVSALARAYARAGRRSDAQMLVNELLDRREREYIGPLFLGEMYAALVESSHACDWLERSYEDRNGFLPVMGRAPYFDCLREEPRFKALMRRLSLPE